MFVTSIWQDVRFALRSFSSNRGFTAAVAISIALGIAANTTVFTMVNALLLGDMPVREPDGLVSFSGGFSFSWPDYIDYREQAKFVFQDVSAHFPVVPASIGGNGEPERVWGQLADAAYFSMVGVPMQLGRGFLPAEDKAAGMSPVVVLSDGLWRRRFGGDRGIIGRDITLNNGKFTVVGVTAAGFHGMDRGIVSEFWVPLAMADQVMPDLHPSAMKNDRHAQWLLLLARLNPGVTRRQALTTVNTIKQRLEKEFRKGDKPRAAITLPKAGGLIGGSETGATGVAVVMMIVVGMVLLIACVNVASLLLSRATVRQKEIGIRLSIGAGRWRLIRQLLTESILLSMMGAVLGFPIAGAATRAIAGFQLPMPIPIGFEFKMDLRVVLFTAGLAVATGILFGLVPALRSTRLDLVSAMKNETQALGRMRRFGLRNMLVLVQVALSLVLLMGAGLFLRSLQNASSIDLGMRTDGVFMMAFDPKLHHYPVEKTKQFVSQLRERVAALPGVTSVSFVDSIPLSIGGTTFDFKTSGVKDAKQVEANVYMVGADYFATMGIPMRRGRDFELRKDTGATLILNEEMARQLYPGQDPLGQHAEAEGGPAQGIRKYEVIGVVRNSKSRTLGESASASAYLFLEAKPEDVFSFYGITVVVRSASAPGLLARAVRDQIHTLDPNLPVFNMETMNEHVNKSMLLPRLCATLLGVFGAVGVILATVGLYGVMSFASRARTREIGIRMALGAQPGAVLRMITGEGLLLAGIGLAIGLGLSFAVTRFTASMLYGVSATDGATFIGVPAIMLGVALVAVLIPARRAARVQPLEALHYE
jgi:predicted permease